MFAIDNDMTISITRGDVATIPVSVADYIFKLGDIIRIKVFEKKNCANVIFQKDFGVAEETENFELVLTRNETKIGETINKPKTYWYEIELNPDTHPNTIVGYDEDGPKLFVLYPEGEDIEYIPPTEEDIGPVDYELSLTSKKPIANFVVAKSVLELNEKIVESAEKEADLRKNEIAFNKAEIETQIENEKAERKAEIAVERARITNLTKLPEGSTTADAELIDIRVGADGTTYETAGESVRKQTEPLEEQLYGVVDKSNVTWELGSILGSSGNDVVGNNRIRTNKIEFSNDIILYTYGNVKMSCYFYNGDTYIKGSTQIWVKEVDFSKFDDIGATHFRLVASYETDEAITNVSVLSSCIKWVNISNSIIGDIKSLRAETSVLVDATKLVNCEFTIGNISSSGVEGNVPTRIRTQFIRYDEQINVFCGSGYKFGIYFYDETKTFLSCEYWLTGILDLSKYADLNTKYFRVAVAYENDIDITNSDIAVISQDFAIYIPSKITKRIFKEEKNKLSDVFDYENCKMPILYLEGDTSVMTKDNAVTLNYVYGDKSGTCTCKWQGSSSVRLGYPKRNYTIKFDNDLHIENTWVNNNEDSIIKNWGEHNKYCAKANWVDPSGARNVVNARLWGQIVATRNNIHSTMLSAPNYGGVDGFPMIVVINGEYEGLYTFNIPKDDWQFGMGNGANEYLLVGESNQHKSCGFNGLAVCDETDFSIEYKPDNVEDTTVINSFNTLIQATIDAGADWETTLAPYIDIESVIDYFIFVNCIGGNDNLRKNILYGTYDGTKWFMSAYDLDTTYGANQYGESWFKVVNKRNQFYQCCSMHRLAFLMCNYSRPRLKARYQELRSTVLSDENVWYMLNNFVNGIPKGIYDLDSKKWTTMPATSTANINNYMNFYRMHCAYLDREIESL